MKKLNLRNFFYYHFKLLFARGSFPVRSTDFIRKKSAFSNRVIVLKRIVILITIFLTSAGIVNSQDIKYARSLIDSLCSPGFYGRGYAYRGDSIAAEFIAGQFRDSGLTPIGHSYFQPYTISVNLFPGDLSVTLNHKPLVPGKDFIISPESPGLKGKFKVITLDEDILYSKEKLLVFLKASYRKVILIKKSDFNFNKDSVNSVLNRLVAILKNITDYNPAAIVLAAKDKLIWSTGTTVDQRPVIYLNFIPSEKVRTIKINIDEKYDSAYHTHNVIAEIPTRDEDSAVVITAHYDHLGLMGKKTYFPGANDNASGTSLMLDLARELNQRKDSLKYPVVFMAFSGEEAGLLGSRFYITHPLFDLNKIKFLINLDIAGTGDDGITVVNATVFKNKFELLKSINTQYNLLPAVNKRGEACNSDHCFFYRAGVPCFFIYTLGGIQAYHDIYDRPQTLPLTAYNGYFRLLKYFIMNLDGNR